MLKRAPTILIKDGPGRSYLHVYHRKVMAQSIMYLARQAVTLGCGGQLFDFSSVISQQLVRLCQCRTCFTLACRDSSEDHDEHYAGTIDHSYRNRVNPATPSQQWHEYRYINENTKR